MPDKLHKGALNDACCALAREVLWKPNGASNDLVETLAAKFQDVALNHLDFVIGQGRDPNLITRAVYYLQVHAIPPRKTDVIWFKTMLDCVIEMAVPNSNLDDKQSEFLKDIRDGIDIAEHPFGD